MILIKWQSHIFEYKQLNYSDSKKIHLKRHGFNKICTVLCCMTDCCCIALYTITSRFEWCNQGHREKMVILASSKLNGTSQNEIKLVSEDEILLISVSRQAHYCSHEKQGAY